jgi:hypothetical protein
MDRVLGVGLHSVTRRSLELAGRGHLASDTRRGQRPIQAEPSRAGLIGDCDRTRQVRQPRSKMVIRRGQSGLEQLAREAIDRRSSDGSCVHVEPNTRTLGKHRISSAATASVLDALTALGRRS